MYYNFIMRKTIIALLTVCLLAPLSLAIDSPADQAYINLLFYKHNKLELVTKKRLIDEKRNYSNTDINSTTLSWEAYSNTSTNISTNSYSRSEVKEVNDWFIYMGGINELNDWDFLQLLGEQQELARITVLEDGKARMRTIGNVFIGGGVLAMLGAVALSSGSSLATGGALGMTAGFFLSAFNLTPAHYIRPEYAQAKIDQYNIALKRKLNLPLNLD